MPTDRIAYRTAATKKQRPPKRSWRNFDDYRLPPLLTSKPAESLCPSPRTVEGYAQGDRRSQAIIAAWEPALAWQSLIRVEVLP